MKEFKGTSGEWLISNDGMFIESENLSAICQFFDKFENDFEFREANAKLIASAPELLKSLSQLLSLHEREMKGENPTIKEWQKAVREGEKAIEKALG